MIAIQPQYLTLAKLFEGRLFRIPEYQRAYSWTRHQRQDLFSDIEKIHAKGPDEGHFMAAVVCLRRRKQTLGTDEFHVLDIVDGQQRLTTLIILFKALGLALDVDLKAEAKLARELAELLVKAEAEELLLLQTNHDSSHYFAKYLREGVTESPAKARTIADREILGAIEDCARFVINWKKNGYDLLSLAVLLKNRLFFLLHEIDDEKAVYTVFEVLNSRGLDVSWLDRFKSILMGRAFELRKTNTSGVIKELHTTWRDVYSIIGLRQGLSTESLRFAATLRVKPVPSRPLNEEDAVNVLSSEASSAKNIRAVASWLLDVTKACDALAENVRINAVTRISQARLLATAIHLRKDLKPNEREALLARWEKISFRIYGLLSYDARTKVGDYVRLAWQIVNDKLSVKEIYAEIGKIGLGFSIEDAINAIRNENCYESWESELRYLMYRYEEHLARQQNLNFSNEQWQKIWMVSPSESIEHIWARSNAPQDHMHRLGNLVLLPPKLNAKLQDKLPKDKVEFYHKTGLLIAGEVVDLIKKKGWSLKVINEREQSILAWVRAEWAD